MQILNSCSSKHHGSQDNKTKALVSVGKVKQIKIMEQDHVLGISYTRKVFLFSFCLEEEKKRSKLVSG